jgi:hypothetical protein
MEFLLLRTKASDDTKGFDWLRVCNNPLVCNYVTPQCDILVTPDGNTLTAEGKAAIETVLCPQGCSFLRLGSPMLF